ASLGALGEAQPIEVPGLLHEARLRVGAIVHLARDAVALTREELLARQPAAIDQTGQAPRGVGAAAEADDEDVGPDVEHLALRLWLGPRHAREGQELADEPAIALEDVLVEPPAKGPAC